ncbi:hypothetical protein [Corallococcus interemptor]|uniref:hypothetical protein n=1 Tax=Corallococcus interemptor TaxID=2316720 RepID=UPI0013150BC2|nr:hypothetical protein [Corallococcus interemptor]
MMSAFTFQVRAPELHLNDSLDEISSKIKNGSLPQLSVRLDEKSAALFRPQLESDWGSLYSALPDFFSQFVRGRWHGKDHQHLPTTLVGDFGEFLTARVLRQKGATRIARVIRAAGLPRPDFVAWFPKRSEVIAIEVKSGSVNARRLEELTRNATRSGTSRHSFNLCAHLRDRRQDGIEQLNGLIVHPGKSRPPVGNPLSLGHARVPAHRSAVATPYFIDGRVAEAGMPWSKHSVPRACKPLRCMECVSSSHGKGMPVLLPIFFNSKVILEPLKPPNDLDGYVRAHALAASAVWTKSETLFQSAWKHLVSLLAPGRQSGNDAYALDAHLLDVLAAAVEADIVSDVKARFSEASFDAERLEYLVSAQLDEAESIFQDAKVNAQPVGTRPTIPSAGVSAQPAKTRPTIPNAEVDAQSVEARPTIPGAIAQAVPPRVTALMGRWEKYWRRRPNTRRKNRRRLSSLDPIQVEAIGSWIKETETDQSLMEATLEAPSAAIHWLPVGPDEQQEFRISAVDEQTARVVATTILELLVSRKPNAKNYVVDQVGDDELSYVVARDGPTTLGEVLISRDGAAIVRV